MTITPAKTRCLILSCSRTKNGLAEPLPAAQRYTGPMYQVLHRYLREKSEEAAGLTVYILSARYGLIDSQAPILPYDQKMTPSRAEELQAAVLRQVQQEIVPANYAEIFLAMGQAYLLALDGLPALLYGNTKLIVSRGPAGGKLTELRDWLWELEPAASSPPAPHAVRPNVERETAVLRGHTLSLTTAEAEELLRAGITTAPGTARQVRNWYLNVAGELISPKWAAQHLFGVPAGEFSADEARRVLRRLGLNCYQQ